MMIIFTVPGAPQGKGRARVGKTRSGSIVMHTPDKTVIYERAVGFIAQCAMTQLSIREPLRSAVSVQISAVFSPAKSLSKLQKSQLLGTPCTKKPDADNIAKIVCDALNGIVWVDDSQVSELHVTKRYGTEELVQVIITANS